MGLVTQLSHGDQTNKSNKKTGENSTPTRQPCR